MKRIAAISAKAKEEFEDRYYWVEDQDGDAQVQITKLTPAQEPEIIKIDKEEAVLQLNFDATYSADLSYNDLGTASYDSEDGRLIYAERRREEVEKEQKLVIEVRATYDQVDPGSFEIIDISLSDPPMALASSPKTTTITHINDCSPWSHPNVGANRNGCRCVRR
jgi:hypothetical protein